MSFIIYPAIDLKDGQAVRLQQGDINKSTVYGSNPKAIALDFETSGAKWIHLVDLDGAFTGESKNLDTIKTIVSALDIPIQLGGGIRTMDNIKRMLDEIGIKRVVWGTAATKNPDLGKKAVQKYGRKIAVGIDAKDGYAAVNGWSEKSNITAVRLAEKMKEYGVKTIIYTDISKDGMMQGPNIDQTKQISDIGGFDVILSGGISCRQDIINAINAGFSGVITGKAIYQGAIDIREVLKLC